MAKISARGCHKLAEVTRDVDILKMRSEAFGITEGDKSWSDACGGTIRYFYVLRSDGQILQASSYPFHPGGSYYRKRGGYSLWKSFSAAAVTKGEQYLIDQFRLIMARKHGAVMA